jgi:hypothetical protein
MWPELAITAGSGLLQGLLGNNSMSPEQRRIFDILKGKLGVAQNVQGQIDTATQGFQRQANQINASEDASMARRGMPVSPGQTALAHADTNASFGGALSQAIPQIQHNAKQEELGILSALSGMAPGPDNRQIDFTGLANNLMQILNRKKKPNYDEPSYSNLWR